MQKPQQNRERAMTYQHQYVDSSVIDLPMGKVV
ncbi:MAG TPA: isomerase/hydrolase, partial [Pseudomonas sp.]|nr:isomerase/hydrolase [Pseudomonas sp.]